MIETTDLMDLELFAGVDHDILRHAEQTARLFHFQAGEHLFNTGEIADCMFIVVEGLVKVSYITINGSERIIDIAEAGDIFGALFFGRYRQRIGQAQAITDTKILKISEDTLYDLVNQSPTLAINFIRYSADRHRQTIARMHALLHADARCRLMGVLLTLARQYCCPDGDTFILHPTITQEDIANLAGLNRSTVSSLINTMRREDVLGGSGRNLIVYYKKVEELLKQAGFDILE